jgi:hypothetical protein
LRLISFNKIFIIIVINFSEERESTEGGLSVANSRPQSRNISVQVSSGFGATVHTGQQALQGTVDEDRTSMVSSSHQEDDFAASYGCMYYFFLK